jgi:biotin synthesis protein BioG
LKAYFISKKKNKLILFFNGWSLDYKHLLRLKAIDNDVLIFYNYTDMLIDEEYQEIIASYSEVIVIGWSMGVFAAGKLAKNINNISYSIAINGTLSPIDDQFGIPVGIFDATLMNFNIDTREKFYKRMFKDIFKFEQFLEIQPERDVEDQRAELISLQNYIITSKDIPNIYNQAIISKYDKIIPANNQINFWKTYKLLDEGHYPFFLWESFEEIIEYAKRN